MEKTESAFGILREKSFDDCRHIAATILADCDVIIFWNFKHIANVKTVKGAETITTTKGYKDLLIYPLGFDIKVQIEKHNFKKDNALLYSLFLKMRKTD